MLVLSLERFKVAEAELVASSEVSTRAIARRDGVAAPKADGGQRPLGVPPLEDKIGQGAVAELLSAVYEVDFLGFSYGFRPGRNPHMTTNGCCGWWPIGSPIRAS